MSLNVCVCIISVFSTVYKIISALPASFEVAELVTLSYSSFDIPLLVLLDYYLISASSVIIFHLFLFTSTYSKASCSAILAKGYLAENYQVTTLLWHMLAYWESDRIYNKSKLLLFMKLM